MLPKAKTVYFHVDVNSAFLSWTAIQHLANGETLDLRTVPAVVGGDEEKRKKQQSYDPHFWRLHARY